MTWPILVEDDRFDLDRHVVRVALPAPGSPEQLDAFVSEFLSAPSRRSARSGSYWSSKALTTVARSRLEDAPRVG